MHLMMTGILGNKDTSYFEMGTMTYRAKKVIIGNVYLTDKKKRDLGNN